jgi:hypothetical protein
MTRAINKYCHSQVLNKRTIGHSARQRDNNSRPTQCVTFERQLIHMQLEFCHRVHGDFETLVWYGGTSCYIPEWNEACGPAQSFSGHNSANYLRGKCSLTKSVAFQSKWGHAKKSAASRSFFNRTHSVSIFSLLSLFWKNKSRLMRSPCCLPACESPVNFWTPEPIFMKLGMYTMAPQPISTTYFINTSHQSVFLCVSSYRC